MATTLRFGALPSTSVIVVVPALLRSALPLALALFLRGAPRLGWNVLHLKFRQGQKVRWNEGFVDANVPLHAAVHLFLRLLNESHHHAAGTAASSAAASVLVRLPVFRRVVVNHAVHALNIQPTSGHVRGHQRHAFTVDEGLHSPVALTLRHATVKGCDVDPVHFHLFGDPVHAGSGTAKYDRSAAFPDKFTRNRRFFAVGHQPEMMIHVGDGNIGFPHFNDGGVVLILLHQLCHLIVEGGAEQDNMGIVSAAVEDITNRFHEPHVSHPIGFIKHDADGVLQHDHPAVHQIEQTPGASHQDVHTALHHAVLRAVGHTAVH